MRVVSRFAAYNDGLGLLGLAVLAIGIMLTGCSSQGNQFVGTWVDVQNAKDTLVIKSSGDDFKLEERVTPIGQSKVGVHVDRVPAALRNGRLYTLPGPDAPEGISLTIDASTGHLLYGGVEYQRAD